jgi:hypothetical protein
MPNALAYLDEKYQTYVKLIESSQVVNRRLRDSLAPLPINTLPSTPSTLTLQTFMFNEETSGSDTDKS